MRFAIRFALCMVLTIIVSSVQAATPALQAERTCATQRSGVPYKSQLPSNFKLAPPCKNAIRPTTNFHTYWLFLGDATIEGHIEYRYYGVIGESSFFVFPNDASKRQLPIETPVLQLRDPVDAKSLQLPKIKENRDSCWRALITVSISNLEVINDDTDRSGDFPVQYAISKIGRWIRCPTEP